MNTTTIIAHSFTCTCLDCMPIIEMVAPAPVDQVLVYKQTMWAYLQQVIEMQAFKRSLVELCPCGSKQTVFECLTCNPF